MSCDYIKAHQETFFKNNPDLNQDLLNTISSCEDSLKNQKFTKKLYELANEIRGNNSICSGISYLPKLLNFDYLLLEIPLDPISYQKTLDTPQNLEKKYNELRAYFRYWAYQSIGNFRLHRAFWQEYNNAIEPLKIYFQTHFNFDEGSNIYYTSNALNEFLNWAVGETKIFRDISPLSQIVANKNYNSIRLQDYIYTNNPSRAELTLALRAALLNQRDSEILELLLKFGARLDEGYESAIFYALENYENTKFLIEKGADVNQANGFGKTPLFYAIEFGDKKIIELLIENGANVNQKYINNNEKLALSANVGKELPYFITFCSLEHTSKNILMQAAAYGDTEILKLLVSKGASLFDVDDLGFNALDFALATHKDENAKYLKSLGLKANENLFYGGSLE
ncbi:MAG: ankyrin repeat domain-containing protein [Campylobacter sp.]|nr:ankyrin repeat domain-containing protein [Campylobacter sp.]